MPRIPRTERPGSTLAASVEPNPLNPSGVLRFTADRRGPVTIRLYDLRGRLVRSIWSARVVDAGEHRIRLDATDGAGRPFASGIYFSRIEAGTSELRGRFTVLK